MADGPVDQRPDEGAAPGDGDEQAERGRTAQVLAGVEREEDRAPAQGQAVGHHHGEVDAEEQPGAQQERVALAQIGPVGGGGERRGPAQGFGGGYGAQAGEHEQRGDGERGGVDVQDGVGADERHEEAGEGGAGHPGAARDGVVETGGAGERGAGAPRQVGEEDAAGGLAGCVEEAGDGHQGAQHPELQQAGPVEQRDRGESHGADEVRDDGDPPPPEPVDDRAAGDGRDEDGQGRAEGDDPGLAGASRGLEREPRDADEGERIAGDRYGVGGQDGRERDAVPLARIPLRRIRVVSPRCGHAVMPPG